jgi:signal transduction histidine kinase
MVIVGYIVTFAFNSLEYRRITGDELFLGFFLGVIYLFLGLNDRLIFDRLPAGWADLLFFSVQCSLVFGIGLLHGIGGNVLIGVPLVGFAVERLKPWPRLVVYVALVISVALPIGFIYDQWNSALINGITIAVMVLFVAIFAQMRLNEQHARERAENLMIELEQANIQLADYATQAEELAMTQERNRLAREIHDNLGHYLTIVNVQIEAAKVIIDTEPSRALDAMNKAQDLALKGLTRVRESVAALRESPISNRPLHEAIASLVKETQSTGIVTEFKVSGVPQLLESKTALALYRAAQEGLTNVRKHARASRVDVLLDFQPSEVRLEVKDNGVGVEETSRGFGLLGIRERMRSLGGRLEINSAVGKGFCLSACVPVLPADIPANQKNEKIG